MQELWLGPGSNGSSFESDEHRREAWFRNRDKIMELWGRHGRRPVAWWFFEAAEKGLPPRHPGLTHEQSILFEFSDALGADERAELEQWWRKQFDKTWDAGFSFCREGRIFTGDVARELAWIAMDLPVVLHARFMAERQRYGRVAVAGLQRAFFDPPSEGRAHWDIEREPRSSKLRDGPPIECGDLRRVRRKHAR
jgi:hypothetical protein